MTVIKQFNPGSSQWEPVLIGAGVPPGGSIGQVLAKNSATSYDTEWVTAGGGGLDAEGAVDAVAAALVEGTGIDLAYDDAGGTITITVDKTEMSLTKGDVGLANVDNTSDLAKPISTATQTALNAKADSSSLSGYQPVDTDLTTIAGLTATTNNVIQSVGGAWASRTPTQVTATLDLFSTTATTQGLVPGSNNATTLFLRGDRTWAATPLPGSGTVTPAMLSNSDFGDFTVSAGVATIDSAAVTLAKMANLAQDQVIGRVTASTGVPETFTVTAAARTVLDDTTVAAMLTTLGGQGADATLTALAQFNTNGILTQTAADTFAGRTITGTTNRIVVTNGNGVSANPTLDVGTDVYVAAGTDVAVADGGTGRSTSTTAYGLIAAGTTATGAHQTISPGTSGHILVSGGGSALAAFRAGAAADVGLGNVTNVAQAPAARLINTTAPLTGGGDLTADRTLAVNTFSSVQSGVVPSSGGGTTNYLRADGTWAAPPGGGGGISTEDAVDAVAAALVAGTGISSIAYDDTGNTITVNVDDARYLNVGGDSMSGPLDMLGVRVRARDVGATATYGYFYGDNTAVIVEGGATRSVKLGTEIAGTIFTVSNTDVSLTSGFPLIVPDAPSSGTHAANKAYVDNLAAGLSWKESVRAATTTNGTLASAFQNAAVIDGVTLATGNRILLKNQTTTTENGIYTVNASGAPTRATDADAVGDLEQATVFVSEGTANADTAWVCTTNGAITPGTTGTAWAQFASSGGSVPTARLINTTAPLTGGGDLSADRTLAISNFTSSSAGAVPNPTSSTGRFLKDDGTWATVPLPGSGTITPAMLASSDFGQFTVAAGVATIDAGTVTLTQMANLAQDQVIGRVTASTGVPETFTVTAAARGVLDDTTTAAMLTTLGAQPVDTDLTTIAGLTATTNNIIQSVSSAWASRTPTQVTATLDNFTATTKGLVPPPTTATGKFLKDDGTWATVSSTDTLGPDGDKGDITVGGTGTTLTIDNDAVTYAKIQNVSATSRILGRITAAAGDIEELTGTQATSLLDLATASLKGLAPAFPNNQTTFLRGDGTYAAPPAPAAGSITLAMMANLAQDQFIGRVSPSTGVPETATITAAARTVLDDTTTAAMLTTLGGQPLDTELTALAALTSAADQVPYFTGAGAAATTTVTAAARGVINQTTTAAMLTSLGAQPSDTELTAIAGLTSAADQVPYFTGSGTASLMTVTSAARSVLDDTSTANMLTTLGAQPVDTDLTTIAGLTATTNNMIQSVSSAWASRTPTQVTATLDVATTTLKGLVPAPGTATGKYLKDDLTWATPAGGGGGATKYSLATVGGATSQVITHNLNSQAVLVQVYRTASPYDTIECDVERTSVNTCTLRFSVAPATNEYSVVVIG